MIEKSDRLKELEAQEARGWPPLTGPELIELNNLQSGHVAALAGLNEPEPEPNPDEPTDYNPAQIDYGYRPRKMTAEERDAFHAIRGTKPSFWERIKGWFGS